MADLGSFYLQTMAHAFGIVAVLGSLFLAVAVIVAIGEFLANIPSNRIGLTPWARAMRAVGRGIVRAVLSAVLGAACARVRRDPATVLGIVVRAVNSYRRMRHGRRVSARRSAYYTRRGRLTAAGRRLGLPQWSEILAGDTYAAGLDRARGIRES